MNTEQGREVIAELSKALGKYESIYKRHVNVDVSGMPDSLELKSITEDYRMYVDLEIYNGYLGTHADRIWITIEGGVLYVYVYEGDLRKGAIAFEDPVFLRERYGLVIHDRKTEINVIIYP